MHQQVHNAVVVGHRWLFHDAGTSHVVVLNVLLNHPIVVVSLIARHVAAASWHDTLLMRNLTSRHGRAISRRDAHGPLHVMGVLLVPKWTRRVASICVLVVVVVSTVVSVGPLAARARLTLSLY